MKNTQPLGLRFFSPHQSEGFLPGEAACLTPCSCSSRTTTIDSPEPFAAAG